MFTGFQTFIFIHGMVSTTNTTKITFNKVLPIEKAFRLFSQQDFDGRLHKYVIKNSHFIWQKSL